MVRPLAQMIQQQESMLITHGPCCLALHPCKDVPRKLGAARVIDAQTAEAEPDDPAWHDSCHTQWSSCTQAKCQDHVNPTSTTSTVSEKGSSASPNPYIMGFTAHELNQVVIIGAPLRPLGDD